MLVPQPRLPLTLATLAAMIALIAAASGLADPGLYRPMVPDNFMPGTLSQDTVTIVASSGVILCALAIRRGLQKAWLVWLGLVGYLAYANGLYAFERITNEFFLAYVAVLGLSIYAIIGFFLHADLTALHSRNPPRRLVASLFALLVVLFVGLWLSILLPAMAARLPPEGNSIFVFDLAFVLPLLAIEVRLLQRASPLGDLLAVPLLIKSGTLGTSVLLAVLFQPMFQQPVEAGSIALYGLLGFGPLALVWPYLRRLRVNGALEISDPTP